MPDQDPFAVNILGVENLISSGINKTNENATMQEGPEGEEIDVLDLPMNDEELLNLKEEYESKHNGYYPKIKPRQEKNKLYYVGKQRNTPGNGEAVIASNLIFEAEETFIPQALSKNPEPVVWSDNTDEGKSASNDIKTMLQYHADVLCLRKKLGVMVRHWSIYFTGVIKHGWNEKIKDITLDLRKPQNFVFDPDGYVNEYGDFVGQFLGERIECSAEKLIELFPKHKDYIFIKVDGKLGTNCVRTEWWNDDYCFTTFADVVLDKHKNEYFNYEAKPVEGETATPGINHFATPKMPYTFLSVFSLQERPHDVTNLIEQSIPNQDRITDRDDQISRNLKTANNSLVLSQLHGWTSENAREAAQAVEDGDPILAPADINAGIQRLPASPLPAGILDAQQIDKDTLRTVFGTQGLTAQPQNEDTTARGMILNQSHDSSRIGGGIGDALEQVADNIFNWWLQLYCVFYDVPHYGAVMGSGRAVEYVSIVNSDLTRRFVVSVSPNSMQPKDEITEQNMAIELWQQKALDPITLFKKLNYADPMETAKQVAMWVTNPQLYMQTFFPESQPAPDSANPQVGGQPGELPGSPPPSLGAGPANASLSQVPLPK
jgi:hypothetical protein